MWNLFSLEYVQTSKLSILTNHFLHSFYSWCILFLDWSYLKCVFSGWNLSFLLPTYGLFETVYAFTLMSMGWERDVLMWSNLSESLGSVNQFDTKIIRNSLILSKISEPKTCRQEEPLWMGHSNTSIRSCSMVAAVIFATRGQALSCCSTTLLESANLGCTRRNSVCIKCNWRQYSFALIKYFCRRSS